MVGGLVGGWVGGWVVATGGFQDHTDELEPETEKRGAGTWVDDEDLPSVGVKVSASSRDPATVKGIRRKTPAKRLREKYHNRRNLFWKMEKEWQQGRVPAAAYWALQTEVQNLAEEADAASWANGEPFTDSAGIRRLEKQLEEASIVARAIHLYRHRQRTT